MNVDSKSLFTTQTQEPTGASRPSRASNGILIKKNRRVSSLETECTNFLPDGIEGNINETVSDRRSSFKNESSKDHNAAIEDTDSEDFDLKNLKIPLEDRRINAKRHANQAILFTGLVEDRLAFLEQQLQRLQKLAGEDPIVLRIFKDSANAPGPSHNPEIKHMTWAEWKSVPAVLNSKISKTKHCPEGQNAPKSVLEVLIEDPQVTMRRRLRIREKAQDGPKKRSEVNRPATTPKPDASTVNAKRVPERLRIRSRVLLEILEQVTDVKLPPGPHGLEKLVMLRPFKLLFTYEDKIRKRLRNMEELYQRHKRENAHDEMESCGGTVKLDSNSLEENTNEVQNDSRPGLYSNLTENYQDSRSLHNADADDLTLSVGVPLHETNTFEGLEHLRLLVKFMDDDLKPIVELRKKISSGELRSIAFADLWHLFEHGQEVRAPGSDLQLYRVLKFTGGREILDPERDPPENQASIEGLSNGVFILECFYFAYDGVQYGPVQKTIAMRRFEGERDINTLQVYPLQFDQNREVTQNKLIHRGWAFARFSQTTKTAHKQYAGLTLDEQKEEIDSQIIVDFQLAFLKRPDWKPDTGIDTLVDHDEREYYDRQLADRCDIQGCCGNDVVMRDYEIDELSYSQFMNEEKHALDPVEDVGDLTNDDAVLFPNRVYGFILRSRKWATFNIDLVKEVEYTGGWTDLVLPATYKETVLALVQNHARGPRRNKGQPGKQIQMDLVSGKGKGLIILLHGEPGVGKTSTAECVADHTKRPLFGITCGDIGDNATSVEENLENNFQLAHKWGCVLLLDEADVFLRKRDKKDMTRNAIVSVFLRTLEYYSGILFLTTNRVGTIDQAFKSRIHVSLLYPRLKQDATLKIWKNHLVKIQKQFKKNEKSFDVDKRGILDFAKSHYKDLRNLDSGTWNGRQIRNAFQTAIALAEYEAGENRTPFLVPAHFKKVADASKEFDIYLKNVYGGQTDANLAMMEQSRLDEYSPARAIRMENNSARRGTGRRREKIESESESLTNSANESENEESEEDKESGSERRFRKSSDRVVGFMD